MKIGIMQPYFVPYLGYWQLMNAVDKYIVYDDVNFIKGGRINRNNILINGESKPLNLILTGASPNKHINDIKVDNKSVYTRKLLAKINMSYSKAPYFDEVFPLLEKFIINEEDNLGKYLFFSFKCICEYLGIKTELILSSTLDKNCELKGKDKVISIVKSLNGNEYYNSINGMSLYDKKEFLENGIKLSFLKMNDNITYKQFNNKFVSNLSIIDVMMFNSKNECKKLLQKYTLI